MSDGDLSKYMMRRRIVDVGIDEDIGFGCAIVYQGGSQQYWPR